MGRAPQISVGHRERQGGSLQVAEGPQGAKDRRLGARDRAPTCSSTTSSRRDGLKPSDVSIIGVGTGAGAIAAMKSGQIDAISNTDPVMTKLEQDGAIKVIADTRTLKGTEQMFGGPMPAASLYAPIKFVRKNPNTVQALTNAIVRADKWLQRGTPQDVLEIVPESLSARRPGPVSFRLRQGEGGVLDGRDDLRRRCKDDAQGPCRLQSRGQSGGDQARGHLHERVREESEREVQVAPERHLRRNGGARDRPCLEQSPAPSFRARIAPSATRRSGTRRCSWAPVSSCRWSVRPVAANRRCSTSRRACSSLRPGRSRCSASRLTGVNGARATCSRPRR